MNHNLKCILVATEKLMKKHEQHKPDFSKQDNNSTHRLLPKLMLTPYFDLRGDKVEVMKNTPLCTSYMLFLNRAGTLGHIIHIDDVYDTDYDGNIPHRREPIPAKLRGAHPEFIRRYVLKKLISKNLILE